MKSFVKGILLLAVAALYIVSTMGYGVHRCVADGTASLILLFGETPCEYVHSHIDENGTCYTHAHAPEEHNHECAGECHHADGEEDGCCSTEVYVLTQDQNTADHNLSITPQETNLLAAMLNNEYEFETLVLKTIHSNPVSFNVLQVKDVRQAVLCTFII